MTVDDLVTWLRAQLDRRERFALAAGGTGPAGQWHTPTPDHGSVGIVWNAKGDIVVYDEGSPTEAEAAHIAEHGPARVLAEVDADRRILDLASAADDPRDDEQVWYQQAVTDVVRLRALPYAGWPGYRDEWAPDA